MLNSVKARAKSSQLEYSMNKLIVVVFFVQLVICMFAAFYNAIS